MVLQEGLYLVSTLSGFVALHGTQTGSTFYSLLFVQFSLCPSSGHFCFGVFSFSFALSLPTFWTLFCFKRITCCFLFLFLSGSFRSLFEIVPSPVCLFGMSHAVLPPLCFPRRSSGCGLHIGVKPHSECTSFCAMICKHLILYMLHGRQP